MASTMTGAGGHWEDEDNMTRVFSWGESDLYYLLFAFLLCSLTGEKGKRTNRFHCCVLMYPIV